MILFFYACAGFSILLTSLAQIFLKSGASKKNVNKNIYLNRETAIGYGLLLIVTVLSILALEAIELNVFYSVAYSLNFILVAILSWKFIGEPLSRTKIAGILLIALGIVVFNL